MRLRLFSLFLICCLFCLFFNSCSGLRKSNATENDKLIIVAENTNQWTGVAVSFEGRMFVNFPRWSDDIPMSVGELDENGNVTPYPDEVWNAWDDSSDPEKRFVCVQSVYVDKENFLWILDPANPKFQGVVERGPKLVKVDLETDEIEKTYLFRETIAPENSYLNDVRIDAKNNYAYITDSGTGALIVVNLETGEMRRVLENHESTKSEDVVLNIGGKDWIRSDGSKPRVHADGVAFDETSDYIYYQALTGKSLYRIPGAILRDECLLERQIVEHVEYVTESGASDGIICGPDGSVYLSSLEYDAVRRYTPEGKIEIVVQDDRLKWPDSFSFGPEGWLYVTTSQIHLGSNPQSPYRIMKVKPLCTK